MDACSRRGLATTMRLGPISKPAKMPHALKEEIHARIAERVAEYSDFVAADGGLTGDYVFSIAHGFLETKGHAKFNV